jgi:CheY-like chemotaxis protein
MALFEIEDTGPGISADEIEQVFEPFARGSAVSSAASGGTGLGLTISKMLTDLMGGEMTVRSTPESQAGAARPSGTLFRIRLFLPEVRAAVAERELPRVQRIGYAGTRRCVLVVDNEEVDRELLSNVLSPLGFDVRRAASGHDCLALLEAGDFRPDAILMDLAMPGIDGWETIRRLRAQGLSEAPVAIVSANAFDKGLDNDAGITPADFVLKPVRKAELLDWLGRTLGLEWLNAPLPSSPPAAPVVPPPAEPLVVPAEPRLRALEEMIDLGYFRGIVRVLDGIESETPACAGFVGQMRELARRFQLDAMSGVLRKAREARVAG